MMRLLFMICLACSLTACGGRLRDKPVESMPAYPVKIDLPESIQHPRIIKMSDIADSIVYIPLKPPEDCSLDHIIFSAYFEKSIFVYGGTKTGLLRFDRKGKFLNEAGSVGRGQQDYHPGSEFSVIEKPERIFILSKFHPTGILELDYNGFFIDRFLIASINNGDFEALSSEYFLMLAGTSASENEKVPKHLACIKNKNDEVLSAIIFPESIGAENAYGAEGYEAAVSGKYFSGNPLFFDGHAVDTVYSVRGNCIYPRFIIDKGHDDFTVSIPGRYRYIYPIGASIAETPCDFHIVFIYRDRSYLATYNKESGTITSMGAPYDTTGVENSVPPTFMNDIDGGISVVPGKSNRNGDVWTYFIPSGYLKEVLTQDHFVRSVALYPDKKEALQELVQNLENSNNPVVMAVYLKKR